MPYYQIPRFCGGRGYAPADNSNQQGNQQMYRGVLYQDSRLERRSQSVHKAVAVVVYVL